jgi:hypothetical protein
MKYFKNYSHFLLEYYQDEDNKKENNNTNAPYDSFIVTFNNEFKYNGAKVDEETYKTYLNKAIKRLNEFITKNTKNGKKPKIEEIELLTRASASWVNTDYGNEGNYNYINNKNLAEDRANNLSKRVTADIKNYLAKQGYDVTKINFVNDNDKGIINNKASKEVLNNFIKDNFENNKELLVEEIRKQIKRYRPDRNPDDVEIKFFKTDEDKLKTRPDYEADEKYYEVLSPTKDNAEKIYNLLLKSPAYVTYTAKLENGENKIEDLYKKKAQYSKIKVVINPNNKPENKPDTTEEVSESPTKIILNSIPFKKDSSVVRIGDEYKLLLDTLKRYENKLNDLKYLLLIGHAESDDELVDNEGNPIGSFNPNKNHRLINKKLKKKTYFTEDELADLRFILSMERTKNIVKELHNDIPEIIEKLIKNNKIVTYQLGTTFYEKLKDKNPRIVQIMIQFQNGFVDTEKELGLFPSGAAKNNARIIEFKLIKALKYNIRKLYNKYLNNDNVYNVDVVPPYSEMNNIMSIEDAKKYRKFKSNLT